MTLSWACAVSLLAGLTAAACGSSDDGGSAHDDAGIHDGGLDVTADQPNDTLADGWSVCGSGACGPGCVCNAAQTGCECTADQ